MLVSVLADLLALQPMILHIIVKLVVRQIIFGSDLRVGDPVLILRLLRLGREYPVAMHPAPKRLATMIHLRDIVSLTLSEHPRIAYPELLNNLLRGVELRNRLAILIAGC